MKTALVLYKNGVTVREAALLIFFNAEKRTRSDASRSLQISRNAVGQICAQLERKGMIEVSIIPIKSSTKGPVTLTKAGKEIAKLP